jgi:glutamate-1-semialdehyde 2,1-aminomutase
MDCLSPDGGVYQAGTLSGNPLAMSAGIATLNLLKEEGFYDLIEKKSAYLCKGLSEAAAAAGVATSLQRVGGMFCTYFQAEEVFNFADVRAETPRIFAKFFRAMLEEGINLAPSQYESGFMSAAHSTEDLDKTIEAAGKAFRSL